MGGEREGTGGGEGVREGRSGVVDVGILVVWCVVRIGAVNLRHWSE